MSGSFTFKFLDCERKDHLSKVPKFFGCHNFLYISARRRFDAIKLHNPVGFSYIENMLKDRLFKRSRLKFDNRLLGPEKFPDIPRNRPQVRYTSLMLARVLRLLLDLWSEIRDHSQSGLFWNYVLQSSRNFQWPVKNSCGRTTWLLTQRAARFILKIKYNLRFLC